MARYEELENLLTSLKEDFDRFYAKDNQAAGTRVRKGMQDLVKLAQTVRKEVQEIKNKQAEEKKAAAKK